MAWVIVFAFAFASSTALAQPKQPRTYPERLATCETKSACVSTGDAQKACVKLEQTENDNPPIDTELHELDKCVAQGAVAVAAGRIDEKTAARGVPLPAAAIIAGTGQFLIDRAKSEVSAFFVELVGDRVCNSDTKSYFPASCALIANSSDEVAPDLITLSRTFREDLMSLPSKLAALVAKSDVTLGCALEVSEAVYRAWKRDGNVLRSLATHSYVVCKVPGLEILRKVYTLGAIDLIREGRFQTLLEVIGNDASELGTYRPLLLAVQSLLATASERVTDAAATRAKLIAQSIEILRELLVLTGQQQYLSALDVASELIQLFLAEDYAAVAARVLTMPVIALALADKKHANLRRYLGLASGLATAKTSSEVAHVLEQAAAPLGGWKRKHVRPVGLSVTGLVGASAHRETPDALEGSMLDAGQAYSAAPFIGVGLDVHVRLGCSERVGLFLSVLDIGAVASTHFKESGRDELLEVEESPELGFAQVFAPGAYLYASLGHTPAVLGFGVSYVPRLRHVEDTGSGVNDDVDVVRWGGFLAIDVTVLSLF